MRALMALSVGDEPQWMELDESRFASHEWRHLEKEYQTLLLDGKQGFTAVKCPYCYAMAQFEVGQALGPQSDRCRRCRRCVACGMPEVSDSYTPRTPTEIRQQGLHSRPTAISQPLRVAKMPPPEKRSAVTQQAEPPAEQVTARRQIVDAELDEREKESVIREEIYDYDAPVWRKL